MNLHRWETMLADLFEGKLRSALEACNYAGDRAFLARRLAREIGGRLRALDASSLGYFPVAERLPSEKGYCLCRLVDSRGRPFYRVLEWHGKGHSPAKFWDGNAAFLNVTHWAEVPTLESQTGPVCPVCPVCPVRRQAGDRQATGRRNANGGQVRGAARFCQKRGRSLRAGERGAAADPRMSAGFLRWKGGWK